MHKYLILIFWIGTLFIISCSRGQKSVFDLKIGCEIPYDYINLINQKLIDKTIDDELSYRVQLIGLRDNEEYYPWRMDIEKIVFDESRVYSGAVIFDINYSNGDLVEYWFARKPNGNGFTFIYLGNVDYTRYYKNRDNL